MNTTNPQSITFELDIAEPLARLKKDRAELLAAKDELVRIHSKAIDLKAEEARVLKTASIDDRDTLKELSTIRATLELCTLKQKQFEDYIVACGEQLYTSLSAFIRNVGEDIAATERSIGEQRQQLINAALAPYEAAFNAAYSQLGSLKREMENAFDLRKETLQLIYSEKIIAGAAEATKPLPPIDHSKIPS